MGESERLLLWVLVGVVLGALVGIMSFNLAYTPLSYDYGCDKERSRQVEQSYRDCLDPLKSHLGCPRPVGPSGNK